MKRKENISSRITYFFVSLLFVLAATTHAFGQIGTPHFIYGKVFNAGGTTPGTGDLSIYGYIPERPGEILTELSTGSGYQIDTSNIGWLYFEAGNFIAPWSINESIRIIAVNSSLQQSGAVDLILDSSGNQVISDLYLQAGDNVGPIASNTLVNGSSPASIPEGTSSITMTATLDDSLTGNSLIQNAECFAGTDPGPGAGIAMLASDGTYDNTLEVTSDLIDTSSWTEGETYTLYVRGQDSAGNWGATHMVYVTVEDQRELVIINQYLTFIPIGSTMRASPDTGGCPAGFTGKFSFDAELTNVSSHLLSGQIVLVMTLTNGNLLQNADGGPGGAGATLTVPLVDAYADGVLGQGESVDVPFIVCLKSWKPFSFYVDVLGLVD